MVTLTQNLGKIVPTSKGKFNPTAQYVEFDEVVYGFDIFRGRKNVYIPIGTLPTNTIYWQQVSAVYTEELCLAEKFDFSLANNKAFALDAANYDNIILNIDITMSSPSLIYVDTRFGDPSTFPIPSTYDTYYSASDNYNEAFFDVEIRNYRSLARKTWCIGKGTGFSGTGTPFNADTVWVADTTTETTAINVVALNGVTMTGSIIVKKYKYLFA